MSRMGDTVGLHGTVQWYWWNWHHMGTFGAMLTHAAVDIPWPSVVFVPQYFHCSEEGSVADSSIYPPVCKIHPLPSPPLYIDIISEQIMRLNIFRCIIEQFVFIDLSIQAGDQFKDF